MPGRMVNWNRVSTREKIAKHGAERFNWRVEKARYGRKPLPEGVRAIPYDEVLQRLLARGNGKV